MTAKAFTEFWVMRYRSKHTRPTVSHKAWHQQQQKQQHVTPLLR